MTCYDKLDSQISKNFQVEHRLPKISILTLELEKKNQKNNQVQIMQSNADDEFFFFLIFSLPDNCCQGIATV